MLASTRVLAALVVLVLAAAACTGGDEPADEPSATSPTEETATGDDPTEGGDPTTVTPIPLVAGAEIDVDPDILRAAQDWIDNESGLTDMLREEIFLASASQTQDVHHLTYLQQHDDVAVRGAQFIVHIRESGEVIGASQSLTETLPGSGTTEELTQDAAAEVAVKAVPGTVSGEPTVEATWLERGDELRLGWQVYVATNDPPSNYAVVVDATTGEVLSVDRLATDAGTRNGKHQTTATREVAQASGCNAPAPPSACIFVVDPIYASGNPAISPEQANATLVGVPLANLINPGDGNLVGRYAQIAAPLLDVYNDPDNVFGQGGRGGQDITFEAAMTYYWIDYTQGLLQTLGYDYHADDPVDLVPIEPEFPNNAFYLFVEDRIHMGDAPDGVREAEDAQGVIHEYGHALLQAAVPNIISDEGGAFHEGFADLVSVFTTLEFRNGDIGCLFHWAERGSCIRRIDTDLVYPNDLRFEVHLDAEIFTGAVWDVFEGVLARDAGLVPSDCQDRSTNPCNAIRDEVYGTLLGSLPFLTPQLDLADAAAAFAASDQAFYGGRNADIITATFAAHGLDATGSPGVQVMSAGSLMDFERSDAQVALKITHEFRGDLQVDLGVVDTGGNLLCELSLKSPDGQDGADNITGRFDLVGTACEDQLPPSPDRLFLLRVVDAFELDLGTLEQFSVIHNGVRYSASGLPLAIPDADLQGIIAAVGDTAPEGSTAMDDSPPPTAPAGSASVEADIAIQHTYIGDLLVQVAVVDTAAGTVACREDVLTPNPDDSDDDFQATVDLSRCAGLYPPTPNLVWFLRVVDNAGLDEGSVVGFELRGPDGQARTVALPAPIPDSDPEGVVLPLTG